VAGARADAFADPALDRAGTSPIVEEGHVLLPGDAHHDVETVVVGEVQQPQGRDRVGPHRVHAARAHRGEVAIDRVRTRILGAVLAAPEGPVCDPSEVQLLVPEENELSAYAWFFRPHGGMILPHVSPLLRRALYLTWLS
jgi:hypothetical protein